MTRLPAVEAFREALVDLTAITGNVATLRARIDSPFFVAVVKANAYGHGMVPVARAALAGGATHLGVADVREALTLRAAGIDAPILAWLHDPEENFVDAVAQEITVCVSSLSQLQAVARAGEQVGAIPRVHIKVDTGLSRNGVALVDLPDLCDEASRLQAHNRVAVEGIFSHLSNASDGDDMAQAALFDDAVAIAAERGLVGLIRHLCASEAALTLPQLRYEMVRIGIALYGISPMEECSPSEFGLRPAMTLRGRICAVRQVGAGVGVSYNYTYRTERPSTLALVPLGYGEGVPRSASDRGPVTIGNSRFSVSGRVAMDQFVVDCGDATISVGDEVVLFGDPERGHPTVHDWAQATSTIGYEVVTRLGGRLRYRYIDG